VVPATSCSSATLVIVPVYTITNNGGHTCIQDFAESLQQEYPTTVVPGLLFWLLLPTSKERCTVLALHNPVAKILQNPVLSLVRLHGVELVNHFKPPPPKVIS
jgi:hypothetical protein